MNEQRSKNRQEKNHQLRMGIARKKKKMDKSLQTKSPLGKESGWGKTQKKPRDEKVGRNWCSRNTRTKKTKKNYGVGGEWNAKQHWKKNTKIPSKT